MPLRIVTHLARLLTLLLLLSTFVHCDFYSLPKEVRNLIEYREEVVKDIAEKASELYSRRAELVEQCECARHACSNDYMHAPCLKKLGTPRICSTEGRRIDNTTTMIRTPPGTDPENLTERLKESICTFRDIQEAAEKHWNEKVAWIYFGVRDGHIRRFPASGIKRDPVQGCQAFDPRIRPWYIAASTGPKDIVIVVDKSGSMNDPISDGMQTKWDITRDAVIEILDTFTFADYANIVTFSDTATPLWTKQGLVNASKKELKKITDRVRGEKPGGKTNFTAAFTMAFQLLTENCTSIPKQCSNCQKIILFLTDGRDTSGLGDTSIAPSAMAQLIHDLQNELVTKTSRRATIFTYSLTENADDAIPRQIACTNEGSWSYLGPNINTLDALNSYSLYLADGRKAVTPVWVEPLEDAAGLGMVTTVSVPVYAKDSEGRSGVFLGVAGHDVILNELEIDGVTAEQVLEGIVDRAERCTAAINTACESQLFRRAQDERSICADPFPFKAPQENDDGTIPPFLACHQFEKRFYKRSTFTTTWKKAREECKADGGELVSIASKEEGNFMASMADIDGSWVAAKADRDVNPADPADPEFKWLDESLPKLEETSDFWGVGEPALEEEEKKKKFCVGIDTRGALANLFARPCNRELTFICRYESDASCSEVNELPEQGYYKVPALELCPGNRGAVRELAAVDETRNLTSRDVVCDFGYPQRTSEEVVCCSDPNDRTRTLYQAPTQNNAAGTRQPDLHSQAIGNLILALISIFVAV